MLSNAMETLHDAENYMRQYFPDDVMIEGNKTTGHIDLLKRGEVVKSWDDVPLSYLREIQKEAATLCL